jgi:hypothetical protein
VWGNAALLRALPPDAARAVLRHMVGEHGGRRVLPLVTPASVGRAASLDAVLVFAADVGDTTERVKRWVAQQAVPDAVAGVASSVHTVAEMADDGVARGRSALLPDGQPLSAAPSSSAIVDADEFRAVARGAAPAHDEELLRSLLASELCLAALGATPFGGDDDDGGDGGWDDSAVPGRRAATTCLGVKFVS